MLTTAEVKKHLIVEFDDDDTYIDTLRDAAYSFAEKYTGITIVDDEKVDYLQDFKDPITLKHTNVQSITSITYYDLNDAQQSQTDYYLDNRNPVNTLSPLYEGVWPDTNQDYENVVITYQAGYTTIPDLINQAVLLIIGSLYEQRENHIIGVSINKIPVSAEYLLNQYRIVSV